MTPQNFEETRRSLFQARGFAGTPRWLDSGPSGIRTYALVREQRGIPTVLVHGGLAEASVWAPTAGLLDGTVIVLDRPGCGLTSPIDYRGVDYRKHAADWLLGVVDALGAPKVNLVGTSMGGFFSMAFATAHPERVARLALPGAPAGLDREIPLFLRLWGNPVVGRLIAKMKFDDIEALRKRVFSMLVAYPERVPNDLLEIALVAPDLPGVRLASRTMLGAISTLRGFRPELMLREAMETLDVPTLFAWGDRDPFAPPSSGKELAARMLHAEVVVLPDVGHMPQMEAPELLAEHLNAFLRERSSSLAAE